MPNGGLQRPDNRLEKSSLIGNVSQRHAIRQPVLALARRHDRLDSKLDFLSVPLNR
jgi:hypothetical protein